MEGFPSYLTSKFDGAFKNTAVLGCTWRVPFSSRFKSLMPQVAYGNASTLAFCRFPWKEKCWAPALWRSDPLPSSPPASEVCSWAHKITSHLFLNLGLYLEAIPLHNQKHWNFWLYFSPPVLNFVCFCGRCLLPCVWIHGPWPHGAARIRPGAFLRGPYQVFHETVDGGAGLLSQKELPSSRH